MCEGVEMPKQSLLRFIKRSRRYQPRGRWSWIQETSSVCARALYFSPSSVRAENSFAPRVLEPLVQAP
jgi:hypothetical protein